MLVLCYLNGCQFSPEELETEPQNKHNIKTLAQSLLRLYIL